MDGILRVMKKQESLPAMLQTLSTHIYFQYGMNKEKKYNEWELSLSPDYLIL